MHQHGLSGSQHGPRWLTRPQTSEETVVAIETVNIPDNNHYRVLSPDMAHGQSPGPDNTMVPGDSTGHTICLDPCDGTALSQHGPGTSTQTLIAAGPWTQTWSLAASQARMSSRPQVVMQSTQIGMPPPHGQNGLCTPMWPQVNAQTTGPCMVPSRVRSYRHQHRHLCLLHGPETTWSLVIVQTQTPP